MRVLIADAVDPVCASTLRAAGVAVTEAPGLDEDGLAAQGASADAIIVRGRARVTRRVLEAASSLRLVVRAGAGLDNIDVGAARERGVEVRNVPGGNAASVAELTLLLFLALARHLPEAAAVARSGTARRGQPMGAELAGRTLTLVGFGRIGRQVARRARAFDLRVVATDPVLTRDEAASAGVEYAASLTDALSAADLLSVHVPLLPSTRGLIGASELSLVRPGAFLVNAARAEVVDHAALLAALESGHLAGAGLDVLDDAAPAAAPLRAHPRVIVTPHLGAATREAQARVAEAAAQIVLEAARSSAASHT